MSCNILYSSYKEIAHALLFFLDLCPPPADVDNNWGDHTGDIFRTYGVIGQRTPHGLQYSEFQQALEKYRQKEKEDTDLVTKMVR